MTTDHADLYAFVSPDAPSTVTLIANFLPSLGSASNLDEFADDVAYEIHVDNDGDGRPDVTYRFEFSTRLRTDNAFSYNTGPVLSLDSLNWNRRQFYTVTRLDSAGSRVLGSDLACPPCNIGPTSTPNYPALAATAVHGIGGDAKVFAGQRADGFYADLGSVFDVGDHRPFADHFGSFTAPRPGANVQSIAVRVPIADLTRRDGSDPTIGVWTGVGRGQAGSYHQLSRLGNPLFSEVILPKAERDLWHSLAPATDSRFAGYVANPELSGLLPALYPDIFPSLRALTAARTARADLLAMLLTGIPAGLIPGFQNHTGDVQADMLRLNTAIEPAAEPSVYGILGGDLAGFPNGRRICDDVVAIELRALAGAIYALVDGAYKPDAAAFTATGEVAPEVGYLGYFPYLGVPRSGYGFP